MSVRTEQVQDGRYQIQLPPIVLPHDSVETDVAMVDALLLQLLVVLQHIAKYQSGVMLAKPWGFHIPFRHNLVQSHRVIVPQQHSIVGRQEYLDFGRKLHKGQLPQPERHFDGGDFQCQPIPIFLFVAYHKPKSTG